MVEETPVEEVIDNPNSDEAFAPENPETPDAPEKVAAASEELAAFEFSPEIEVMDQKYEIPERLRSVIKDEESYNEVKDILTKAYGLDHVKPKVEKYKTDIEELRSQYDQTQNNLALFSQGYQRLNTHLQRGELDEFFKEWKIDKDTIYNWVAEQVALENADPEQRRVAEEQRRLRQQNFQLQDNQASIQSRNQEMLADRVNREFEMLFMLPDVKEVETVFDGLPGQQSGAFVNLLRQEGDAEFFRSGGKTILSAKQCYDRAVQRLGGIDFLKQRTSPKASEETPVKPEIQEKREKATVVPNVKGNASATTAGSRQIKSIDDLRRIAKSMKAAAAR